MRTVRTQLSRLRALVMGGAIGGACAALVLTGGCASGVEGGASGSGEVARLESRLPDPGAVLERMRRAADWQLAHEDGYARHGLTGWVAGAWYTGLAATAEATEDEKYFAAMRSIGERTGWSLGPREWHADDHTVAQMHAFMYGRDRDPAMIAAATGRFDEMIDQDLPETLAYTDARTNEAWVWCDALYMTPPALAMLGELTGEPAYFDAMSDRWWQVTDYLYDEEEHLFFRDSRFFERRAPNGEKIFWSRGNGWVFAGLARVLQHLPEDHADRGRFEELFGEMAARLIEIQTDDGTWHPSLLAPAHPDVREASGTGFFVYGLAWGISQGMLDRGTYLPHVLRGWDALEASQHDGDSNDGMIGWIQRIGDAPEHTNPESTGPYGVGSFLLAASEVYRLSVLAGSEHAEVGTVSGLGVPRSFGTVEVDWPQLAARLPGVTDQNVVVVDGLSGAFVDHQVIDLEGDGAADLLVFQADYLPGQERSFAVHAVGGETPEPAASRVFGRYVPERKDDFAWENDRAAFRMYGPALAVENARAGIDMWVKSVRTPVIDKWYADGHYHEDHGEGMDAYSVGPTLGCGGFGLYLDGELVIPPVYETQRLIASGPVRVVFELGYPVFQTPSGKTSMTLRVSLDRGHSLNEIRAALGAEGIDDAVSVAGAVARHDGGTVRRGRGWLSVTEATAGAPGKESFCAVVMPGGRFVEDDGHAMLVQQTRPWTPVRYFAGGGWIGGVDFSSEADWLASLEREAAALTTPVRVRWAD